MKIIINYIKEPFFIGKKSLILTAILCFMPCKKFVLLVFILQSITFSVFAQPVRCGTDSRKLADFLKEQHKRKSLNTSGKFLSPLSFDSIVIPIVVHILYNNAEQNITDEQVKSQIDVINEDFAGMNATAVDIPGVWLPLLKDSKIRFCLASRTPGVTPQNSSGITRNYTTTVAYNYNDDAIKYTSMGGVDAWPSGSYLNVWVCNLNSGILGYALLPGANPLEDGIVINYKAFGRKGNLLSKYNFGRSLTHEIGHYLNLVHIWGDDDISDPCSFDDYVWDTPLQGGANFCCPQFPKYDDCQLSGNGVMYMNYMDYSDDKFMQFYTPGQIERMDSAINDYRSSLFTSQGCIQPFSYANDISVEEVIYPVGKTEKRCFQPIVKISNNGSQQVTNYTLEYNILNGNTKKVTVNQPLLAGNNTIITLPEIAGKEKINFLEVRIVEADSNKVNNYMSRSFHAGEENVNGCADDDPFIYPNPVYGESFCAKSNFTVSDDLTIRVLNILGEKVYERSVTSNPGDVFKIEMNNEAAGVYFVQMISADSGSRSAKFIYIPEQSTGSYSSPCE